MHALLNSTGPNISSWRRIDLYDAIVNLNYNYSINEANSSITNNSANSTIRFGSSTDLSNFTKCGLLKYNYASIDSATCPYYNRSAHIIFANLSGTNRTILRNGLKCPESICQNKTYSNGALEFDVTEFSSYSSTSGNINLELTKLDSPDPAYASSQLNYTVRINVTMGNASNITLTESYPDQVIYLSSQPSPVPPTNNTLVIGNLTENQTILVNISVFVINATNGTVINNSVNISFQNDTSDWLNASVSESTLILNPPVWNFTNISVSKEPYSQ